MPTPIIDSATPNTRPPGAYGDPNIYINNSLPVVLTANLPAAATAMDGRILIEDAGTGDRNIIIYAGGQRFRIDGGSAV